MTAAEELRHVTPVSAAPEHLRVAVVGNGTQLDVALPADVPIAAFLPELARLISSHDADDDGARPDEGRTFWALARHGESSAIAPQQTLRGAQVTNGALLELSARPALTPPVLYDDVVDAAARLNRAAYAPWNAAAAAGMAFVGLWLVAAVWVCFLLAGPLAAHRGVIIPVAAAVLIGSVGGAALATHTLRLPAVAAAVGLPALPVAMALGWVLAVGHGPYVLALAALAVLILCLAMTRLVRVGRWLFVAVAVALVFSYCAALATAFTHRLDIVALATACLAALGTLAVPALTTPRPRRPARAVQEPREDRDVLFENPFKRAEPPPQSTPELVDEIPGGDEVWARAHATTALRTGLKTGLAVAAAVGAAVLLRADPGWPATAMALVVAAVLASHSHRRATAADRIATGLPALALTVFTCVELMGRARPMQLTGLGIVTGLAVIGALVGLWGTDVQASRRLRAALAYLDYAAIAALVPVAAWVLGLYRYLR